jgi:tRNA pseudouridine38-40 synthase
MDPAVVPPEAETRRARFVVAYDGTDFRGFAPNHGVRTVLGELTEAIERVVRRPVHLVGAGRTDAGVHGWGQVVSADLAADTDLDAVTRRVNKLCAPDLAVRRAEWAEPGFDARHSATWRHYRYHVWNDPTPNPLLARTSWHVHHPLDLVLMQSAVSPLIGEHDFTSFCRRPKVPDGQPPASMVRIVHEVRWERVGGSSLLRMQIRASAFCHQMVRSICGTLVDVGLRRLTPADVNGILRAKDRAVAGQIAPPQGLVLWEVGYDGERWDARSPDAPEVELPVEVSPRG